MTTTPAEHTDERTPEQAIRETAWQQALDLYRQWEGHRPTSGAIRDGWLNQAARAEALRLRTLLAELVREHQFQYTRVDILGLNWYDRAAASWLCPDGPMPCTHDSETCTVHPSRRRFRDLPPTDCGALTEVPR